MEWLTLKVGLVWLLLWGVIWLIKKWMDWEAVSASRMTLFLPLVLGTMVTSGGFLLFFGYRFLLANLDMIQPTGLPLLLLFSGILFFSFPLSIAIRWPTRSIPLDQLLLAITLMFISLGITLGGIYLTQHLTYTLLIWWAIASFLISSGVQIVVWYHKI